MWEVGEFHLYEATAILLIYCILITVALSVTSSMYLKVVHIIVNEKQMHLIDKIYKMKRKL